MSAEANLWARLRSNMVPLYWCEATRHEDKFQKGIADISFCQAGIGGWMELKHVSDWPRRDNTPIRIPHYSIDQKDFLEKKGKHQGNTWLFLQIGSDYLVYDWLPAQELPDLPKAHMIAIATFFYEGRLDYSRFAYDLENWVKNVQ